MAVGRHWVVVADEEGYPVYVDPLHIVSIERKDGSKKRAQAQALIDGAGGSLRRPLQWFAEDFAARPARRRPPPFSSGWRLGIRYDGRRPHEHACLCC